jgi:hypothetical protein
VRGSYPAKGERCTEKRWDGKGKAKEEWIVSISIFDTTVVSWKRHWKFSKEWTHPDHTPSQLPLPFRLRLDQVPQPFDLRQIHPSAQERLSSELSSLGWS